MHEHEPSVSRRAFIKGTTTAAAAVPIVAAAPSMLGSRMESASYAAETPAPAVPAKPLPTIQLGPHRVTRLVAGANPLSGYSYQGSHATHCMKEYFTPERRVEFLQKCQREGITAHQFSAHKDSEYLRVARDHGVTMAYFGLHTDIATMKEAIQDLDPIALVHHGGVTDRLFSEGKHEQVHDFVKAAHDGGIMAGVSAHNPDCIRRIADEGWDVDFFMTCFYFLTRSRFPEATEAAPPVCTLDMSHYAFYQDDPVVMTEVVRQVDQPCLGFKILAAGRSCHDGQQVCDAIQYAFANLKPSDGVIVGMFPRYFDEIRFNVEATHRFGQIGEAGHATA